MGMDKTDITAGQLADELKVNRPTMEKRVRRTFPDLSPALSAPLSAEQIARLSAGRTGKVRRTKRQNPGVTSEPARANELAPIAPADVPESFLHTKWALYSGMVVCMISQMIHTAGFFFINSPIEQHEVQLLLCILFALGVDSTALILTIRRGGKIYLWTFAVCHFLMNVTFHVQAHEFDLSLSAMVGIFGYLLLSFVIAYANFSYTDLFSHKKT